MKTATGDLFHFPADALCITTNGFVKNNGEAVMGRGCALQATQRIPELPALLGKSLLAHGTHVIALGQHMGKELVSFPVKPAAGIPETQHDIDTLVVRHWQHKVRIGQRVPGFACKAVPELIERSAYELVEMANKQYWERVVLPRPGCGAGELDWERDIHPLLYPILDDRFICVTY